MNMDVIILAGLNSLGTNPKRYIMFCAVWGLLPMT